MGEVQREELRGPDDASVLIVLIHGLRGDPRRLDAMARAAQAAIPEARTYTPRLCYSGATSAVPPEEATSDLLGQVETLVAERAYERIVVVGYSMGSLIARKLVILAHGQQDGAVFEPGLERWRAPRDWAGRIERLVLMAGIPRGWTNNAAQGPFAAMLWSLCALAGDVFADGRWTVLQMRAGAPFVVQTRLQWLALTRRPTPPELTTVQLLGSVDDMVAPEDTIDFLSEIARGRFILLQLPDTNHAQALELEGSRTARRRRVRFMAALSRSPEKLAAKPYALPAKFITNGPPPVADMKVDDVVFVVHGIRDRGFWTQKIAHRVMEEAERAGRTARSMTLSYGYLAMGPFLLRRIRREKVRWLMDRYTDCRALYPRADFHYVGHSNGTYLAARALADYPAARFRRIVFAGSVVRCDYGWDAVIRVRKQVESVLNYVASGDWVVAIFPNGVSRFPRFDLGGAGHLGFNELQTGTTLKAPGDTGATLWTTSLGDHESYQIDYVRGRHAAGIKESQWDEIAAFIVNGEAPLPDNRDFIGTQGRWVSAFGRLPPAAFATVVAAALVVIALLVAGAATVAHWASGSTPAGIAAGAAMLLACIALVRLVITRL